MLSYKRLLAVIAIVAGAYTASAKGCITIKSTVKNDTVFYVSYNAKQLALRDYPEELQYVVLKKGKATIPVPPSGAITKFGDRG